MAKMGQESAALEHDSEAMLVADVGLRQRRGRALDEAGMMDPTG